VGDPRGPPGRARGRHLPHGYDEPATVALLKSAALVIVAGYCGLAALLWLLQDKLLFHPMPVTGRATPPKDWTMEAVRVTARDATVLAGVLVKPPGPPAPLLISYGGNAEEATEGARTADRFGTRALLLVNYRGYGDSQGVPSEPTLFSDALEILDWVSKRTDVDTSRIGLIGGSLGSGVAVHVAAQRPVKAVVLVSPYDSVADVAAAHYGFLPVRWLVHHPFDSMSRARGIRVPALIVVGSADTTIPPSHSTRLAGAWGGPHEALVIEGKGHNDLYGPEYEAAVRGFLDKHL